MIQGVNKEHSRSRGCFTSGSPHRLSIQALAALLSLAIVACGTVSATPSPTTTTTTTAETLVAAARLYADGDFDGAAAAYQHALDQGARRADVYYNLGNAWLQGGDVGRAIASYRRAERLAPRDPDIQANLALARGRVVDAVPAGDPGDLGPLGLVGLAERLRAWLSPGEMGSTALALWWALAVVFVGWRRRAGRGRTMWGRATLIAAALLGTALAVRGAWAWVDASRPAAVVVAESIPAAAGPGPASQFPAVDTLHAGAEVTIAETRAHWVRVSTPDGRELGWLPAAAIERVAPVAAR